MPQFFATAPKGTEVALRDELRALRFRGIRADRGGVHFEGGIDDGYRACLELRCAVRVLVEVTRYAAPSEHDLYEGAREVPWERWIAPQTTLAVRASCRSSRLTHSQFIAQKTKDAIVDRQRDELGARSSVDRDDPDALVSVHLVRDEATLYLDLSGRSLHLRGYRTDVLEAPLKETLAAALLRFAGYSGEGTLVDPMCGSGTIAIEAALMAADVAPGLGFGVRGADARGKEAVGASAGRFGFERWASFDATEQAAWRALRERAEARKRPMEATIVARDVSGEALAATKANAARAGVSIAIERASVTTLKDSDFLGARPIYVVTNPPYGERIELPPEIERAMGRALAGLSSATVGVLAGGPALLEAIPRRPSSLLPVMNGDLECRFAIYEPGREA